MHRVQPINAQQKWLALLLVGLAWQPLQAQEANINLGGSWTLTPTLGLAVGYDDNLALSATDPLSSEYVRIQPALRLDGGRGNHQLRAQYELDQTEFRDSEFDDFADHELSGFWRWSPSVRHQLQLDASVGRFHDRRGEGLRENFAETLDLEVDEYRSDTVRVGYVFGAEGARGRLGVFAEHSDKRYQNNREFTAQGDYEQQQVGGEFSWRVGVRTALLARVTQAQTDYDSANLDSDERAVAVGVRWDGSEKGDGRALVGRLDRDFDNEELDGFAGSFWQLAASWRPVARTQFSALSRRSTDEAFGGSNLVVREELRLGWRHNWRPRFATSLDAAWLDEDFRPVGRDDEIRRFGVSADYQFRRWLLLGLGLRREQRDSPIARFDYDRTELVLSAQLSL
ncbi:MAG: outer membrane beta-barrel protein [Pseudomonadota bacterium]